MLILAQWPRPDDDRILLPLLIVAAVLSALGLIAFARYLYRRFASQIVKRMQIRDWLWLTILIAVIAGWSADHWLMKPRYRVVKSGAYSVLIDDKTGDMWVQDLIDAGRWVMPKVR
jgi:hypothetical protein